MESTNRAQTIAQCEQRLRVIAECKIYNLLGVFIDCLYLMYTSTQVQVTLNGSKLDIFKFLIARSESPVSIFFTIQLSKFTLDFSGTEDEPFMQVW